MTTVTERMKNSFLVYNKTPHQVVQTTLDLLQEANRDIDIVDPTNAYMHLLESAATMCSASCAKSESVSRKMYAILAQNKSELFNHLSDRDYAIVFAQSSQTTVKLFIPYADIDKLAVASSTPNIDGYGKWLRIPRDSRITVDGYTLGIHYPIDIQLVDNNAPIVRYAYDSNNPNPLQALPTNVVPAKLVSISDTTFIELDVQMFQFSLNTVLYTVDGSSSFKESIPYSDQFLYARVFRRTGTDETNFAWTPLITTYSVRVVDPVIPTAIINVNDATINILIPDIYASQGFNMTNIRVDLYTTKGKLEYDLSKVSVDKFVIEYINNDNYARGFDKLKIGAIQKLPGIIISSTEFLSGGDNGLSFPELKDAVVYKSLEHPVPILETDVLSAMSDLGYTTVKLLDNVTDKVYLTSKPLKEVIRNDILTITNASLNHVVFDGIEDSGFNYARKINGNSTTIFPTALYKYNHGKMELMSFQNINIDLSNSNETAFSDLATFYNANREDFIIRANRNEYFYSPFFYIIDYAQALFKIRAYYLHLPKVVSRYFISSGGGVNAKTKSLTTQSASISLDESIDIGTGVLTYKYLLVLNVLSSTKLNTNWYDANASFLNKQRIRVLIKFPGSEEVTFTGFEINAETPINPEGNNNYVFTIPIYTDGDIDQFNRILLFAKKGTLEETSFNRVDLTTDLEIRYMLNTSNTLNQLTDYNDSNDDYYTANETMQLQLGKYLEGLHTPGRTILSDLDYAVYQENVYAKYISRVYRRNEDGSMYFTVEGGKPQVSIIHEIGDLILDNDNQPIILYRKGEIIRDTYGKAQVLNTTKAVRELGIFMLNAKYSNGVDDGATVIWRFANNASTNEYINSVPIEVLNLLENEVVPQDKLLTERVDLLYVPKGVLGSIRVDIGSGNQTTIDSTLDFTVRVYLTRVGALNKELQKKLTIMIKNVLIAATKTTQLSIFGLLDEMKKQAGPEVLSVDMDRFGPNKDIAIMTIVDENNSFNIHEELVLLKDGSIDVADSITVTFIDMGI